MRIGIIMALLSLMFTYELALAKVRNAPDINPLLLDDLYIRPDGAILTWPGSHTIDPYFPTKALLLAQDNGMDIKALGLRWVEWMLAHQSESGLFKRYCFEDDQTTYTACGDADADDAMMAMWIELLYRLAPRSGLPGDWAKSAEKSLYQLDLIFDRGTTVFFISSSNQNGLLMDNIEIYAAYKTIERNALRIGDTKAALSYRIRAEYLKNGIIPAFWEQKSGHYKASTQHREVKSFYPDTVMQLMPLMYHFDSPAVQLPPHFYREWMKNHRAEWFDLIGKEYPWGLLAILALQQGDRMTAHCWRIDAEPYRHTNLWNVLDEAAFQVVQWKLRRRDITEFPSCDADGKTDHDKKTKRS